MKKNSAWRNIEDNIEYQYIIPLDMKLLNKQLYSHDDP